MTYRKQFCNRDKKPRCEMCLIGRVGIFSLSFVCSGNSGTSAGCPNYPNVISVIWAISRNGVY